MQQQLYESGEMVLEIKIFKIRFQHFTCKLEVLLHPAYPGGILPHRWPATGRRFAGDIFFSGPGDASELSAPLGCVLSVSRVARLPLPVMSARPPSIRVSRVAGIPLPVMSARPRSISESRCWDTVACHLCTSFSAKQSHVTPDEPRNHFNLSFIVVCTFRLTSLVLCPIWRCFTFHLVSSVLLKYCQHRWEEGRYVVSPLW